MSKKVIYVGHRGTKLGVGVENTKEAYLEAAKLGYKAIETDIRVTLDKEYICCHDENLIRLTRNSSKKTTINVQECHFRDIKDLELSEITNGVKRIGKNAFEKTVIDTIQIPSSVKNIGDYEVIKSIQVINGRSYIVNLKFEMDILEINSRMSYISSKILKWV